MLSPIVIVSHVYSGVVECAQHELSAALTLCSAMGLRRKSSEPSIHRGSLRKSSCAHEIGLRTFEVDKVLRLSRLLVFFMLATPH